jgi:hypothetical protein
MNAISKTISMDDLRLHDFVSFLRLSGWQDASTNGSWHQFVDPRQHKPDDLEIVLPSSDSARDLGLYIRNGVELLGAILDQSPETVALRIAFVDSDLLSIKNLESGEHNSIALKLAAQQIKQIRQLVELSAQTERNPKPYFSTMPAGQGKILEHYRFGHTFAGSFGFRIESPVTTTPYTFDPTLFNTNEFVDEQVVVAPFARRVMERMARGLVSTDRARISRDISPLVDHYASGFNANMCMAIIGMSDKRQIPLEYSVVWSPKLKPLPELAQFSSVQLNQSSYQLLQDAVEVLKETEPEYIRIRGMVTELSSADDPRAEGDITRLVVVRWNNRPGNARPVKVIVPVSRTEYQLALDAHRNWNTVEVTGRVEQIGANWRLFDTSRFEIVF